jgi:hypothetical protein
MSDRCGPRCLFIPAWFASKCGHAKCKGEERNTVLADRRAAAEAQAQEAAEKEWTRLRDEFYGLNPEHKSLTDKHLFIPAFIAGHLRGAGFDDR